MDLGKINLDNCAYINNYACSEVLLKYIYVIEYFLVE
jgi:hypothetical protein